MGEIVDVACHRYEEAGPGGGAPVLPRRAQRRRLPELRALDVAAFEWAGDGEKLDPARFSPADVDVLRKVDAMALVGPTTSYGGVVGTVSLNAAF